MERPGRIIIIDFMCIIAMLSDTYCCKLLCCTGQEHLFNGHVHVYRIVSTVSWHVSLAGDGEVCTLYATYFKHALTARHGISPTVDIINTITISQVWPTFTHRCNFRFWSVIPVHRCEPIHNSRTPSVMYYPKSWSVHWTILLWHYSVQWRFSINDIAQENTTQSVCLMKSRRCTEYGTTRISWVWAL